MFKVDSNNKPVEDPLPIKTIEFFDSNFFLRLFSSLVKPMIIADIFLRWFVQLVWRGGAAICKEIAF
jgi:hypothetical protein